MAAARNIFTAHDYGYIVTYASSSDSSAAAGAYTLTSFFTFSTYAVILWSSWRVWRHMRLAVRRLEAVSAGSSVAGHMSEALTQLNIVLVAQAIGPLLFAILPVLYLEALRLFGGGDVGTNTQRSLQSQSLVTVCLNWLPLTNALVTLAIIRPYRRFVIERLCLGWIWGKAPANPTVPVTMVSNRTDTHFAT